MLKVGDTVRIVKINEDEFTTQDKELIGEEFEIKFVEEGFDFPYILDVYGTEIYFDRTEWYVWKNNNWWRFKTKCESDGYVKN